MQPRNLVIVSPHDPSVYQVHLPCGRIALVEEEDVDRILDQQWRSKPTIRNGKNTGAYYVASVSRSGGRKEHQILMHRHLFALDQGDRTQVDHRNGDGLDNRRKANLRLATHRQNQANRKKLKEAWSKFKGVSWNRVLRKWTATVTSKCGPKKIQMHLGYFDVETEAAFAYNVIAPQFRDKRFVKVNDIPEHDMPSTTRQKEIESQALLKAKSVFSGRKAEKSATSQHRGVSFLSPGKWRCLFMNKGKQHFIGTFGSESEAAVAYNVSLDTLGLDGKRRNDVDPGCVSSDAVAGISSLVAHKLGVHA